jgi:hypothetical protein
MRPAVDDRGEGIGVRVFPPIWRKCWSYQSSCKCPGMRSGPKVISGAGVRRPCRVLAGALEGRQEGPSASWSPAEHSCLVRR